MHESVLAWTARQVADRQLSTRDVVELGAYDVNGTARVFFDGPYLGVDMRPGPGVDQVANAHDTLLRSACADVVICQEMLEHDDDPAATFREVRRLLRRDGVALVTTRSPGYPLHEYPDDHHRFCGWEIECLAYQAGLDVLSIEADPQAPGVFALLSPGKGDSGPGLALPGTRAPKHAGKVMVGYCHPGEIEHEFHAYLHETRLFDASRGGVLVDQEADVGLGPRLHIGRDAMVRSVFLPGGAEWLWCVDDDMAWTPADFYRLMAAADPVRRPIVGGVCFGSGRSGGPVYPGLEASDESGTRSDLPWLDYPRFDTTATGHEAVVEVEAASWAFLLVHRSVFYDIADHFPDDPFPWFPDGWDHEEGVPLEGDLAFFKRARAAGIPVHVHTGARTGHKKPTFLTEDLFDLVRALQAEGA